MMVHSSFSIEFGLMGFCKGVSRLTLEAHGLLNG